MVASTTDLDREGVEVGDALCEEQASDGSVVAILGMINIDLNRNVLVVLPAVLVAVMV